MMAFSLTCNFVGIQEWKQSFAGIEAVHDQLQQSGLNVMSSTARLGHDLVTHELRDITAQMTLLNGDAARLEAELESLSRAYEEFDRTSMALTERLADAERRLEQLNRIDFLALEKLEADCKVSLLPAFVAYFLQ